MTWIELKTSRSDLLDVRAEAVGATSVHQFFYEPWHPTGAVVRVEDAPSGVDGDEWTGLAADESLYGDAWPQIKEFFAASSALFEVASDDLPLQAKLIHCVLNSWGFSWQDEQDFHAERATVMQQAISQSDRNAVGIRRRLRLWLG